MWQGYRRILVPTDFSPPSRDALAVAVELASTLDAELELLHVVTPLASDTAEAAKRLDEVAAEIDSAVTLSAKRVVRAVSAVAGILDAAREGVDLIVTGTHGGSSLRHVLLGSVAEALVRLAPCPVLTVRHESPVTRFQPLAGRRERTPPTNPGRHA